LVLTYQLEEPFLEEKGKITSQKEVGGNRMQLTYLSDGIMKGTIKVTNEGNFVSISSGNAFVQIKLRDPICFLFLENFMNQ
jgi:hypothetical protein